MDWKLEMLPPQLAKIKLSLSATKIEIYQRKNDNSKITQT